MYTPEMLESMAKVEAHRARNLATEPRRMTAEEKEALLKAFHPDYKEEKFTRLQVGPNAGEKVPLELAELLQSQPRFLEAEERAVRRPWRLRTRALLCCWSPSSGWGTPTP